MPQQVVQNKHYICFYRFFSRAQWSVDDLGLTLLALVIKAFPSVVVELVLDDTLVRRTGKKVALATVHADPLLKMGSRCFMSYGHVFVVLSVHVTVPLLGPTGWALPFMFRLYEGPKQGGRKDSHCGREVLHVVHEKLQHTSDNVSFIVRGRPDAALYELPPLKRQGQMGRPRVKGAKLPKPAEWAEQNSQGEVVPLEG